jgi:type II secretory pathway pseudopilin PulG
MVPPAIAKGERGSSLILVVIVLVVTLIGGLAAVAITSGQLAKSRGFRVQALDQACAEAGLARVRASLPNIPTFDDSEGTISAGATTLTYRAGHYDGDGTAAIEVLDPGSFDSSSLLAGENITNVLGTGGGDLGTSVHVLRITAVCGATGHGEREVETIFRYGLPTGAR